MESSEQEEFQIESNIEEMNQIKKKNWIFLNDIDSLISQLNSEKKLRCIVFDTETTGINYKKDHILELAAVEVENFKLTGKINAYLYKT